jgi:excisionase family DNA binding protein
MDVAPRFLRLPDVAEILNVSESQARALVTSGELPAIQVGGRRQWRIERSVLETYIQEKYDNPRRSMHEQPADPADAPVDAGTD